MIAIGASLLKLVSGKNLAILAVILVVVYHFYSYYQLQQTVVDLNVSIATMTTKHESEMQTLTSSIDAQNQSIRLVHEGFDTLSEQVAVSVAQATVMHASTLDKFTLQMAMLDEVPKLQSCESAIQFAVSVATKHKWSTEKAYE